MKTNYSKEQFIKAVKSSTSYKELSNKLNLTTVGGNRKTFKKYILLFQLDISHFENKLSCRRPKQTIPIDKILVKNSSYASTHRLKIRLVNEGYFKYECFRCKAHKWQGETLSLTLHHIDGDSRNNLLENLQILCPNCHSLTTNFAGKNKKTRRYPPNYCIECGLEVNRGNIRCIDCHNEYTKINCQQKDPNLCKDCGKQISKKADRCKSCARKQQPTKIDWPETNQLLKMIKESSCIATAKQLGVSDKAIQKRIKNHSRTDVS